MTVKRGSLPAPNAGAPGMQAPLPWKCPMGAVKVYYVGRKVFKTKAGNVEKTVIHYERNGTRYAFASARPDVVADLAELAKVMTKADGRQTSVLADFAFAKGGTLTLTIP